MLTLIKNDMKRFQKGDRVFDIRYGWGIVEDGFASLSLSVYFKQHHLTIFYDKRFVDRILSYTEYILDGQSLDIPEPSWEIIWDEFLESECGSAIQFLDENFEPPVRKCK
jgi:hypothetical protein